MPIQTAVILNAVPPRAQAGAEWSEESLTETRAEVAGEIRAHFTHRLRPLLSAVLHSAFVAKPPKTPFRMTAGFGSLRAHRGVLRFCASVLAAFTLPTFAELPVARLDTVFPPGGKSGSEIDLVATGADLDEASALHFTHPGITATLKPDKHFAVTIAPDVPPGLYDIRVSGALGVSNPRTFVVGELPEIVKTKPCDKPEAALELPLGSVVNGTATAATGDYFKFSAKAGQRVLIECAAPEIDSRLSPVLAVLDSAGRELATSRRGGLLDFTAPTDASYVLRLHDLAFAGGPEHFYRLTLTTGPHADFVLPDIVQPGTKTKLTFFGRNLPGGTPASLAGLDGQPLQKIEIEVDVPAMSEARADGPADPASAAFEGFSYRLKTAQGTANPVFISFASAPIVAEREPNNQPPEAQKITPPCEISGQFFPGADVDSFTFDAKKGDVFWIEITSQRLGLPTRPALLIQRDNADLQEIVSTDANVGGKRFDTASNDSAGRFEVKEDGTYRLRVRDLFGGLRSDPRSVYRLSIRRESPDFRLVAVVEPPPTKDDDRTAAPRSALIRGGGTIPIKVVAFRRDGFAGNIDIAAEGLPAGVTSYPTKILAGKSDGLLLLTASEAAARWVGPIRIVGKAKIGETELACEAQAGAVLWSVADYNNDPVQARLTRDFPLAVSGTEAAPVSVDPVEDKVWEVAAGAKLEIPLRITRRGEFKEALKLKGAGAPGIETLPPIDIDPAATTATATLDLATVKIPAGTHAIFFSAQTKGKFRNKADVITVVYTPPIRVVVKAPEAK